MVKQTIRVIPYARAKSVHPAQIRNWVRRGLLPAVVIGRTILLDAEECDRVLETFKRQGKQSSTALPAKIKRKQGASV